ncbi:MAG: hypothetical protein ABSG86_00120 [Thermoguttaceae bacterium]|jgi:hypothetical protein
MRLTNFWKRRRWSARRPAGGPARARRTQSTKLRLECLEDRRLLSIITPTTTADGGAGSGSLRAAIIQANLDGGGDTIRLGPHTYNLTLANTGDPDDNTGGNLDITASVTIIGSGPKTVINQTLTNDRVFQIDATTGTVAFQNLVIQGGHAVDDGTVGSTPYFTTAEGGGILDIGGAKLTLTCVTVQYNYASGGTGTTGRGAGQSAEGGGVFMNGGTLTLINSAINNNTATGGNGVNAVAGSPVGTPAGAGGFAAGGGLYATGATVVLGPSFGLGCDTFLGNRAVGGKGGAGLSGAIGAGGNGGNAEGGGLFLDGGSLKMGNSLATVTIQGNSATGGAGGAGGTGTGAGGIGGSAYGGGLYAQDLAIVSLTGALVTGNQAVGGAGGSGGAVPSLAASTSGPASGGAAWGGGLYAQGSTLTLKGDVISCNQALGGAGGSVFVTSTSGNSGGYGGYATGGGVLSTFDPETDVSGTLSMTGVSVCNNRAVGGVGGSAPAAVTETIHHGDNGVNLHHHVGGHEHAIRHAVAGATETAGTGGGGDGGGVSTYDPTTVVVTPVLNLVLITGNVAQGGSGGAGLLGGPGGEGGYGQGGGLATNSLTLNGGVIACNQAIGGAGGAGGNGATGGGGIGDGPGGGGGGGGGAYGGGLAAFGMEGGNPVSVCGALVDFNSAIGGCGGAGGKATGSSSASGGGGGGGGAGQGGGMYLQDATATISHVSAIGNVAQGGCGGAGGAGANANGLGGGGGGGGAGQGGALYLNESVTTLSCSWLLANCAHGGAGGAGGLGGSANPKGDQGGGGGGGNGQGSGAYVDPTSTLNLSTSFVVANGASGGSGGAGNPNGAPGTGSCNGVYVATGGVLNQSGFSVIALNVVTKVGSSSLFGSLPLSMKAFMPAIVYGALPSSMYGLIPSSLSGLLPVGMGGMGGLLGGSLGSLYGLLPGTLYRLI